jgi:hypothetical protein
MLVLHMLTTFLTFSYAKANPVEITLSSYHKHTPTTDCSTGVESYLPAAATNPAVASFASTGTSESLARPMVTSLTESYFEKRQKTCIEQFAWYCQVPAGECLTTLTALVCFHVKDHYGSIHRLPVPHVCEYPFAYSGCDETDSYESAVMVAESPVQRAPLTLSQVCQVGRL